MESIGNLLQSNIDNLHPMLLGKMLCQNFKQIINLKRLGRNIISINFNTLQEVNKFVNSRNTLLYGVTACSGLLGSLAPELCEIKILNYQIKKS